MIDANAVRLIELISSKLCHDIISPVGAISNGVEILEELGPDAGEDVTSLIAFSATQASSKLKALRMAYGLGGADESIRIEDVHKTFEDLIAGEARLTQSWDPFADLGLEPRRGHAKILLCALIFASEGMPKGGVISVDSDLEGSTIVKGLGENAHFREQYIPALNNEIAIDDLDPKLVHAYTTGVLCKNYGFQITIDESQANALFLKITS